MRRLAITGGSGTLGSALIRHFLATSPDTSLILLSRDEVKQSVLKAALKREYPTHHDQVRPFLGDVRDEARLRQAFYNVDAVIHCAALKRVDAVAHDPGEAIKTNVLGSMNVISAAAACGVEKVILVSSDKAVMPANYYGQTKALMEGYGVQANAYTYPQGCKVGLVRYGNVLGSRGSVIHVWREALAKGELLPITDARCTRFWITLDQAVAFVLRALKDLQGGEILVPQLPSLSLLTLARAVGGEDVKTIDAGLRPGGEKIHECMIGPEEATRLRATTDGDFLIVPSHRTWSALPYRGHQVPMPDGWMYTSDSNDRWLTQSEIEAMIKDVA